MRLSFIYKFLCSFLLTLRSHGHRRVCALMAASTWGSDSLIGGAALAAIVGAIVWAFFETGISALNAIQAACTKKQVPIFRRLPKTDFGCCLNLKAANTFLSESSCPIWQMKPPNSSTTDPRVCFRSPKRSSIDSTSAPDASSCRVKFPFLSAAQWRKWAALCACDQGA